MNDTLKLVRSLVTEPKVAFIVSNIKNLVDMRKTCQIYALCLLSKV
jgi:hypothetical protein